MNFKQDQSEDKLRGGYYTPPTIANFLARWALAARPQTILEPSCGDGAFIRAIEGKHDYTVSLTGIEWIESEARKAKKAAKRNQLLKPNVVHADFLSWAHDALDKGLKFDCALGNPPYIRYQYLEKIDQELAERLFRRFKLPFSRRTNAWVPFVIASVAMLTPGGRLGMVVPSELLHVLHAQPLRDFLLATCSELTIVDPQELLFDAALQGTVLLLATRKFNEQDRSKGIAIVSTRDGQFFEKDPTIALANTRHVSGDTLNGKWMKALLTAEELAAFQRAANLASVHRFHELATVDVGIVTGANKFFLVDDETVLKNDLSSYAHPMFGRSEHCRGVIYDEASHRENSESGLPCNFIYFDPKERRPLPKKARAYIAMGERENLHTRYKCSIRDPWYSVPSVYATEVGMLKRSHHFPRLIFNEARAYTTDTAYRIRAINCDPQALVYYFVNTLTCLSAELEGRHYGGGVLELVPSEIEKLLVPYPTELKHDLRGLNDLIKRGLDPATTLRLQDEVVLRAAGVTADDQELLTQALARVRSRRHRSDIEEATE